VDARRVLEVANAVLVKHHALHRQPRLRRGGNVKRYVCGSFQLSVRCGRGFLLSERW